MEGQVREGLSGPSAEGTPLKFHGLDRFRAGDYVRVRGKFGLSYGRPLMGDMTFPVRELFYSSTSAWDNILQGLYLGWRYGKGEYSVKWSRVHFIMSDDEMVILDEGDPSWPTPRVPLIWTSTSRPVAYDVEFSVLSEGRCYT